LLKRIREIEAVIDSHFIMIKKAVIKSFKEGFEAERKKAKSNG
jgi:hypothetical protein